MVTHPVKGSYNDQHRRYGSENASGAADRGRCPLTGARLAGTVATAERQTLVTASAMRAPLVSDHCVTRGFSQVLVRTNSRTRASIRHA